MIRFLILAGYGEMMLYLQISGKLDQFINVHYRYLAILSTVLSLFLAMVQLYFWVKEDPPKNPQQANISHEHDHHEHHHGLGKRYQRFLAYVLLALPILVGTFPTVSLNTTIVQAKGYQFPLAQESVGDPQMETQYLQPNTSMYFNKSDYQKQMEKLQKKYGTSGTVKVTDENYLEVMELIYNYPSDFIGRQLVYEGFVFHAKDDPAQENFVFRFGIIHCVADSGVFGLRVKLPENSNYDNDQWVKVTGVIQSEFYAPFKRTLPYLQTTQVTEIDPPENQYVYRTF